MCGRVLDITRCGPGLGCRGPHGSAEKGSRPGLQSLLQRRAIAASYAGEEGEQVIGSRIALGPTQPYLISLSK